MNSDIPREFHKCRYCEHVEGVAGLDWRSNSFCDEAKEALDIKDWPVGLVHVCPDEEHRCPGFEFDEQHREELEEFLTPLAEIYDVVPGVDCPGACNPRPYPSAGR